MICRLEKWSSVTRMQSFVCRELTGALKGYGTQRRLVVDRGIAPYIKREGDRGVVPISLPCLPADRSFYDVS